MSNLLATYIQTLRRHGTLFLVMMALCLACSFLTLRGADKWGNAVAKRESQDRVVRAVDYMKTGLWQAAGLETALFLALALSVPLWAGTATRDPRPALAQPLPDRTMPRRVFWAGMALIVTLGAVLREPRMDLSVYNDEEHTLRTYTRGTFPRLTLETMLKYEAAPEGMPFKRANWAATAFSTTGGPNQVLFSLLSRATLTVWQRANGLPEIAFSDFYFRLPSFLGGLGLILVLGALIYRETGQGASAWAIALLTATHPWLIRYSTEGRGYGIMLFFCALSWWFALGGLRKTGWSHWIGFGLAQAALLLSYIGSVYVPLVLNLTLLPLLAWPVVRDLRAGFQGALAGSAWRNLTRWAMGNVLTVALFLPMILPLVPQFKAYFNTEFATAETPRTWLRDFASYSLTGVPWEAPEGTELPSLLEAGEPGAAIAFGLLLALALAGTVLLVLRRNALAWLVPMFLLAPVVGYWHNTSGGRTLYVWYLIFVVPGLLVLATAGMTPRLWTTALGRRPTWLNWAVPFLLSGLIAIGGYLPNAWFLHHQPKENLEDAIRLAGRPVDPSGQSRPRSVHIACWTNNPIYDPWAITVIGPETVEDAITYALESGRELKLTYGHRPLISQHKPEVLAMLEDPGLFYPAEILTGLEEAQFDIRISQLRPLDPNHVTRTYHLTPRQEKEIGGNAVAYLATHGIPLEGTAHAGYDAQKRTLVMTNSWTQHKALRQRLGAWDL